MLLGATAYNLPDIHLAWREPSLLMLDTDGVPAASS